MPRLASLFMDISICVSAGVHCMGHRINPDVGVILGQGLLFISAYVRLAGLWAPGVFCLHPSHHKSVSITEVCD